MAKVLDMLLKIIWIVDILNISITIYGVNIAEFLDVTIPINTLAWWLIWIIV